LVYCKYAHISFAICYLCSPSTSFVQDLGLSFLEINNRAYVRTVDANSTAEKAGIQPQDCIQFACVVGGQHFSDIQSSIELKSASNRRHKNSSKSSRRTKDDILHDKKKLDDKATSYVLECEKRGMRTSYNELRDLFAGCTLPPKSVVNNSNIDKGENDNGVNDTSLVTPPRNQSRQQLQQDNDDFTIGSNSLLLTDSVGGMFEHTSTKRKGENVSSRRVPARGMDKRSVMIAAKNSVGRCFEPSTGEADYDDEDGYGNSTSRRRNSHTLDTPLSPIKNDHILSSPSSPKSRQTYGNDEESIVEQSLYPVVLVFRRTVQRKSILSPSNNNNAASSSYWSPPNGLSLKGSLFGIPSFRMDDECDRAAALIRQLAPPTRKSMTSPINNNNIDDASTVGDGSIITTRQNDTNSEDIEASTIRGMIGAAVGLGFVRLSKVVVGVSLQGGSGIIISRLPDGTWSAPSAMGVYGLGVGLQFGLEVADFMFIIQTNEGMEHFKRGGNFVVGGNIGAAVVNCGREAYGAASLGACTGSIPLDEQIDDDDDHLHNRDNQSEAGSTFDDSTYQSNASTMQSTIAKQQRASAAKNNNKKKDNDIAPMVAYAKSQGLYFGVSVDGLKFFTRNDINARTYKFSMLSEMPAKDILSGLVSPPPEAEDLYSALHSVEYTHEMIELPRPPEMLRRDSMNDWRYDRSIAAVRGEIVDGSKDRKTGRKYPLYSFLSTLNREEADRFAQFETKFKKFLYGGVAVQHLLPHAAPTRSGMTRRKKRTLWLMLPEVGSLRLGFVSKLKDGLVDNGMDDVTVASSVASSRVDDDTLLPDGLHLSRKYSVSLTDITTLSQDPEVSIRLSPDDATEHLRVLSINDVTGKSILFLANSNREAELLFSGIKLLLECETARLSVRGGVPLNKLPGGKLRSGAISPVEARGVTSSSHRRDKSEMSNTNRYLSRRGKEDLDDRSKYSSFGGPGSSSDDESASNDKEDMEESDTSTPSQGLGLPSQMPGRSKMRQLASGTASPRGSPQSPTYELGKTISTDIATNISLPLPLSMCRMLFLDSSSPINKSWEAARVDSDYRHGAWTFPPGSVREFERDNSTEQQLVARSSMLGAQRTISYSRTRNRELVRLSETVTVEQDDNQTLVFVVTDQMPRRGFSAKARIHLQSYGSKQCEARVVTEIRPVGKNLTDQQAVHKAFILVLDEMKKRYGAEEKGLLAVFLDVYNTLPGFDGQPDTSIRNTSVSPRRHPGPSITSFDSVLASRNAAYNSTSPRRLPVTNRSSPSSGFNGASNAIPANQRSPNRSQQRQTQERPSTPSMRRIDSNTVGISQPKSMPQSNVNTDDEFADFNNFEDVPRNPVTVEVKPLPKIRLDLCPVPREEDEEDSSAAEAKQKRKSKSRSKSRTRHRSAGKAR